MTDLEKIQRILTRMVDDELLPKRAAAAVRSAEASTTPEQLGMDSLARYAFFGELRKAFTKNLDPQLVASATCLGDLLTALRESR